MFSGIVDRVKREPVAVGAIARAILPIAVMLGLDISLEQLVTILMAVEVIVGFVVRRSVTPVATEPVAKEGA